jgi:hypothetical protein
MFHLSYLHANYLNPRWTWDPTIQYPHTNFKHTLNFGPNLAILTSKTKTLISRNLVIYNQSLYNYIRLGAICNYICYAYNNKIGIV